MYRLTQFDTLSLTHANQVDSIGSGELKTAYHPLPDGGALDLLGDAQIYPGVTEITKTVRLTAATESALSELYFSLLALTGKPYKLYRELVDGTRHWVWARMSINGSRAYEQAKFKRIQDVSITFKTNEAIWRGDRVGYWFFDTGEYFDDDPVLYFDDATPISLPSSPTVFTESVGLATDAGRAPVRAMTLIIDTGDAPMSNITIQRTGGETLTFTGTIPAESWLLINTGTMQVMNGFTPAYDDLVLPETADMGAWFTLLPGDNEITVSFDGGGTGAQIIPCYYEAWR